jgi:hypothetical protein
MQYVPLSDNHNVKVLDPAPTTGLPAQVVDANFTALVAADKAHADETTDAHGGIVASGDTRLTDARTPTAHKTSHATGGGDALSASDIGAVASNDGRLSDARTPTSHKTSHATGGSDALSAADIGAASASSVPSFAQWLSFIRDCFAVQQSAAPISSWLQNPYGISLNKFTIGDSNFIQFVYGDAPLCMGISCPQAGLTLLVFPASWNNVEVNGDLMTLDCSQNGLTTLDLSNTDFGCINVSNNSLTSLTLPQGQFINDLDCSHNSLSTLDGLTDNDFRGGLNCSYNSFSGTVSVSVNTADSNHIPSINFSHNAITNWVWAGGTFYLSALDLSHNALTEECVNTLLVALNAVNGSNLTVDLSGGTNHAPTGAGVTAKNALVAKGATVSTN